MGAYDELMNSDSLTLSNLEGNTVIDQVCPIPLLSRVNVVCYPRDNKGRVEKSVLVGIHDSQYSFTVNTIHTNKAHRFFLGVNSHLDDNTVAQLGIRFPVLNAVTAMLVKRHSKSLLTSTGLRVNLNPIMPPLFLDSGMRYVWKENLTVISNLTLNPHSIKDTKLEVQVSPFDSPKYLKKRSVSFEYRSTQNCICIKREEHITPWYSVYLLNSLKLRSFTRQTLGCEFGINYVLSEDHQVSIGVSLDGEGVYGVEFCYDHLLTKLRIPFKLGKLLDMSWNTVPLLMMGLSAILSIPPLTRVLYMFAPPFANHGRRIDAAYREELQVHIQEARLQQEFMKETARNIKEKEQRKNGLVILKAMYGLNPEQDIVQEKELEFPRVIDVTIPLQFWVKNSTLQLGNFPKSTLLGVFRTHIDFPSKVNPSFHKNSRKLCVDYTYKGIPQRRIISDTDVLSLP